MRELYLNPKKREFDRLMLLAAVALAVIGVLFVFSATEEASPDLPLYKQKFFEQIIWCAVGLAAGAAACLVDYGKMARWSRVIYWASIGSLVAVLLFGEVRNGGRRWLFHLQPSEFAKLAFIVMLADYLSRPVEELRRPRVFLAALGYTALPFILIKFEPDLGSSLVFLSVCLVVMFVAGVPNRFLLRLAGAVAPLIVVLVAVILWAPEKVTFVESYQKEVLRSFFGLVKKGGKSADANYNVNQSLISVGSGGLFGKGWRQGTQHELGYLPKLGAPNDFIFAVIAEEEGFVGSVVVLALYAVLLFSGIKVASQARDRLGQLLAVGVVTLLFTHVFINIGMNIRLMPVTGIPLPLVSYGGSSVVCSLIAIGILHNVHIYRKSY
jgi:rod shape determining protein RodA